MELLTVLVSIGRLHRDHVNALRLLRLSAEHLHGDRATVFGRWRPLDDTLLLFFGGGRFPAAALSPTEERPELHLKPADHVELPKKN